MNQGIVSTKFENSFFFIIGLFTSQITKVMYTTVVAVKKKLTHIYAGLHIFHISCKIAQLIMLLLVLEELHTCVHGLTIYKMS